jgi:hypothetical protein
VLRFSLCFVYWCDSAQDVQELAERDAGAWDAFVAASPDGLPMQLAGWRAIVAASFGVEPRYLLARQGQGGVTGVLPLYLLRSRLTGKVARSMPGGLCASGSEAAVELLTVAERLARDSGVSRLELHDSRAVWPGLAATDAHQAWRVALQRGPEALWERLDRNVRRQVKMAERNGLIADTTRDGSGLDAFYDVLRRVTLRGHAGLRREFLDA